MRCLRQVGTLWTCYHTQALKSFYSVKPDGFYRTSLVYFIINCVFGLLHTLQIFLTIRTIMTTPFEGTEKDSWTKTKHAVSWFIKGFWMAMVQIWRDDPSTRMHGVSFLFFARCWAACCIDVALTVEFGLRGSPWILQVSRPSLNADAS